GAGGVAHPRGLVVAPAGGGCFVRGPRLGTPALPRPPGTRRRCVACEPRQRPRTLAAFAQPPAGTAEPRRSLARRDRARDGGNRSGGRGPPRGDGGPARPRRPRPTRPRA